MSRFWVIDRAWSLEGKASGTNSITEISLGLDASDRSMRRAARTCLRGLLEGKLRLEAI
jgi:hypothetical protein